MAGTGSMIADNSVSRMIDGAPMAPLQIVLIALCYLLTMLDGFDVLAMSFAAPPISEEWSLPPHELGVVFSAALAGMMIGAMFLAPLADVYGRRPVVLLSLSVVGLAMLLTGTVTAVWQLIVLRGITGLGIGAILASTTSTAAEYSPNRSRNTIIGFIQGGYPIGAVVGGVIAAQVIPEFGWRAIFIGGGVLTLVSVVLCWFYLPESAQFLVNKKPLNALKRVNIILVRLRLPTLAELPAGGEGTAAKPGVKALLAPQYLSSTLRLWAAFCLAFCTLYFLLSWVPKLMVDAGLPFDKGVYAAAAINLGGAIGGAALGKMSGYLGLCRSILLFLVFGALGMVAFAGLVMGIPLLLSLAFFIGFFVLGGFIGLYTVAARLYATDIRTTGIGWAIGVARLGAVIGPYVGGVLISAGVSTSTIFLIFAVPLVLSGMFSISMNGGELKPSSSHGT